MRWDGVVLLVGAAIHSCAATHKDEVPAAPGGVTTCTPCGPSLSPFATTNSKYFVLTNDGTVTYGTYFTYLAINFHHGYSVGWRAITSRNFAGFESLDFNQFEFAFNGNSDGTPALHYCEEVFQTLCAGATIITTPSPTSVAPSMAPTVYQPAALAQPDDTVSPTGAPTEAPEQVKNTAAPEEEPASTTESITESITESMTESTTESTTEPLTESTTEPITSESTATEQARRTESTDSTLDSSVQESEDTTLVSDTEVSSSDNSKKKKGRKNSSSDVQRQGTENTSENRGNMGKGKKGKLSVDSSHNASLAVSFTVCLLVMAPAVAALAYRRRALQKKREEYLHLDDTNRYAFVEVLESRRVASLSSLTPMRALKSPEIKMLSPEKLGENTSDSKVPLLSEALKYESSLTTV